MRTEVTLKQVRFREVPIGNEFFENEANQVPYLKMNDRFCRVEFGADNHVFIPEMRYFPNTDQETMDEIHQMD